MYIHIYVNEYLHLSNFIIYRNAILKLYMLNKGILEVNIP